MPILLVGGAGGALKFPGVMAVGAPETRSTTYEQSSGGHNANDVLVTIMKAMGIANSPSLKKSTKRNKACTTKSPPP